MLRNCPSNKTVEEEEMYSYTGCEILNQKNLSKIQLDKEMNPLGWN